jgi:predicted amidohydrolase YtcJ
MKMRKLIMVLMLFLISLTQGFSQEKKSATTPSTKESEMTVFVAKKIITMDPSWPEGKAVVVQDGMILSVGRTLEELEPWLKGRKYKLDETFKDKILTPGLIESHGHPTLGGIEYNLPLVGYLPMGQPYGKSYPGVKNAEQALALIKKYVAESKDPNKPLLVFGWDIIVNGMELDKYILDKIVPNHPVAVWDASAHQVFVNTAFIKNQKLTDDLVTKLPGARAGVDGKLNGKFQSSTATAHVLIPIVSDILKPENAIPRLRSMLDFSQKGGITTQSELTFGTLNVDAELATLKAVLNNQTVPAKARIVVVSEADAIMAHEGKDITKTLAYVKNLEKSSNDWLGFRGVKFYGDDAFISLNMSMEKPGYVDGHVGVYNTQPEEMFNKYWPWWDAGFNLYVHSNGTGGNDESLRVLAELQAKKFRLDHRFALQHYGLSRGEMARTLKTLGGMVSANPYYVYYRGEFNEQGLGTDRANTAIKLKQLVDAGVPTCMHSDSPMGPALPLEWVWIAVNRPSIASDKILAPAERVTVEQAMKMITIDAAFHLGMENKIGSIEAGKFADFTVLEQDPFTVDPMKIRDIPVWGTVVAGRPQASKDIVPEPSLFYRDYSKYMDNLTLTPEEKKALAQMIKVTLNDLPNYYEDAYTTHGIVEMFRSHRNMKSID